MHRYLSIGLFLLLAGAGGGCKKSAFLDSPSSSPPGVPRTVDDCQALLDDDVVMNGFGNSGYPYLGLVGSDDVFATDNQYSGYTPTEQEALTWAPSIGTTEGLSDWSLCYRAVTTANQALVVLGPMHPSADQQGGWNRTEGSAYFFRAFANYQLAQIFAPVYDSASASTDLGIPLRKTASIDEKLSRATVQQTYDLILSDLKAAGPLLSTDSNWLPTRPSRAATYGLLARVYLSARAYPKALLYADSCLRLQGVLMQYDTIPANANFPFHRWNPEVIFSAAYFSSGPSALHRSYADTLVFKSYLPNDLRRVLFFKGGGYFFGRYDESGFGYCGLATDEMYLIRAECYARAGNVTAALDDLNTLLASRWAAGTYLALTATGPDDALQQILTERRKELLFRGTRWTDLRRLNKEPRFAITLSRTINGVVYTLPPNDPRYVYPIPDDVLRVNPMPQNPR